MYALNFTGCKNGKCSRAAFGNSGRVEWTGSHSVHLVPAVHIFSDGPSTNTTVFRKNKNSVFVDEDVWTKVCGGDKEGFQIHEQNWSGAEVVMEQLRIQR